MSWRDIDWSADVIDVEILTQRFDVLENESPDNIEDSKNWGNLDEYTKIKDLLENLEGMGGDFQYNGAWYPMTLIRDSFFQEYAMELAWEVGSIDSEVKWPHNCIDWELASRELKYDYSSVQIDGEIYWTR